MTPAVGNCVILCLEFCRHGFNPFVSFKKNYCMCKTAIYIYPVMKHFSPGGSVVLRSLKMICYSPRAHQPSAQLNTCYGRL